MIQSVCGCIVLGLVLLCSSVSAQSIVADQGQPIVDLAVGGLAIGDASEQQLAQTVTVGIGGELLGVMLPIVCESGRLVIEIRGDAPDGPVLERRRFDAASLPYIGSNLRLLRTGAGLYFAPGDRFAVVLRDPTGACAIFQGLAGDTYAGGEAFFQALPDRSRWIPFSETETRGDLAFLTLMRLAVPQTDPLLDD